MVNLLLTSHIFVGKSKRFDKECQWRSSDVLMFLILCSRSSSNYTNQSVCSNVGKMAKTVGERVYIFNNEN